jgi:hypothetical protein
VAAGVLTFREVNLGLARASRSEPAKPEQSAPRIPTFPLTDPPRRFDTKAWDGKRPFPRDGFDRLDPDEEVDARHLCRRIRALKRALEDIDSYAKRYARRMARRVAGLPFAGHFPPVRLGHPPGHRRRSSHTVDDVLAECHALALHAQRDDTS